VIPSFNIAEVFILVEEIDSIEEMEILRQVVCEEKERYSTCELNIIADRILSKANALEIKKYFDEFS
jgi:hypothetical protein